MIKKRIITLLVVVATILQANNAIARSNLTTSGDILMVAVPLTALGIATYRDDTEGQKEFIKSFLVNTALTHALKFSLKNTSLDKRPNGKRYSFPSGHAAAAFQGAFFLQTRYGTEYGAPAIALSAFTGYTRVHAKAHHWRDVVGGAALAFGVNYFLVTKYNNEKTQISAGLDHKTAMLNVSMKF